MKYSDILLDNHKKDAWVRRNVWSASKFLGLGIVISALLYLGLERQNEKLESLAKQGQRTQATVTKDDGKFTDYKYEIDGQSYEWNVESLGMLAGDKLDIIYEPIRKPRQLEALLTRNSRVIALRSFWISSPT